MQWDHVKLNNATSPADKSEKHNDKVDTGKVAPLAPYIRLGLDIERSLLDTNIPGTGRWGKADPPELRSLSVIHCSRLLSFPFRAHGADAHIQAT
jgi:hypothetical protein